MDITGLFGRRSVLKAGALLGGLSALLSRAAAADAQERNDSSAREAVADEVRMAEIPLNPTAKVTVERRLCHISISYLRLPGARSSDANTLRTSDWEIPNCLAIREGVIPALKLARTAFI
jgi:hypothetical protein